jgi:hypothetical protein
MILCLAAILRRRNLPSQPSWGLQRCILGYYRVRLRDARSRIFNRVCTGRCAREAFCFSAAGIGVTIAVLHSRRGRRLRKRRAASRSRPRLQ